MAIETDLIGTITLTAGQLDFSVVGFSLKTGGVRPGEELILPEKGLLLLVGEVLTETTGKLTDLCPAGAAGSGQKVRLRFQPDGTRFSATSQDLMEKLTNGNLDALADLSGGFELIPMFVGPGAMDVIDKADLVTGVAFDVRVDTLADRATYDANAKGFRVLVSNIGDGRAALYTKKSNTLADWSTPSFVTGPIGPPPNVSLDATETLAPGTPANVVNTGTATAPKFKFSIPQGHRGWMAQYSIVLDGVARAALQLTDWVGGTGTKPTDYVGMYVGASGFVSSIALAINVKGNTGSQGPTGTPWQGTWNAGTSYQQNDLVIDNDAGGQSALWIALRNNTAKKPKDNAADWAFFPASFATTADYGLITDSATDIRDYGSITS